MGIAGWNPKVKFAGAKEYFDAHVKKHQKEPDRWASAFAYASLQILERCVGEVGLDRPKIKAMLDATEFQTVAGPIKFTKGENVATPGMVGQWQKNEFELVWPKSLGHRDSGGAEAGLGVTLSPTLLLDVVIGGFTTGGIYALVALGLNLQYGLMRVLNVAHGEFLMLGAYVTFSLHTGWGVNPLLTLLITGPTAFAVGLALHRLLYAPLLGGEAAESLESRSLLLSFGLMFVLQNAALLIWSADLKGYSYLAIPLRWLGTVFPANRVLAAAVALALGVAFYLYLRYSLTGKAVRALMQEPEGAQLVGIQTSRIHGLCFGAGLAMSAVTGSLVSMLFELTPFMGLPYTVTALVVVILGGLGNMLGCLMAGLLLGLVETAGVYLASSDIRLISSYAVLSLILVLKPSGLFGR